MILHPTQVDKLIATYERCCELGESEAYSQFHRDVLSLPAIIQIPIGEMINERLEGFWSSWSRLGVIADPVIPQKEIPNFTVQGIEGIVRVRCDLVAALLVASEVGTQRCRIEADVPELKPWRHKTRRNDDDLDEDSEEETAP